MIRYLKCLWARLGLDLYPYRILLVFYLIDYFLFKLVPYKVCLEIFIGLIIVTLIDIIVVKVRLYKFLKIKEHYEDVTDFDREPIEPETKI